ncbi:efflux transporter outer membrane subunit [Rhizobium sp. LjRoot254]|uniref:efflux transporter outer membrane subunit n=1 Tax=Rhizobium sp. LjRoot254 TaxID=3342297 RepID=UPI003ECE0445
MRNVVVLLAAGSVLAACSTEKFVAGPEVTLTENYKYRAGLRGETIHPDTKWWANFGDRNLNALIDEALADNLTIEAARERVKAAMSTAKIANNAYLPQVDAVASAALSGQRNKQPVVVGTEIVAIPGGVDAQPVTKHKWVTTNTSSATKGLAGSWYINPLGWKSTKEREEERIEAEREALNAARLDIIASVADAYVNVQGLGRQIEIAKRSLQVQNETADITIAKVEAGSASTLDSTRAKANAALTSSDIPALEQLRLQYINLIATLLGKTPAELDSLYTKYNSVKRPRVRFSEGIPADLLRNRPDIRQQERLLAAAVADIGVAESDLWPQLVLNGNITASRTANAGKVANWNLGPSITLPIFNRGALHAAVDLSKSGARLQYLAYRQTVIQAAREVEDAVVALRQEQMRASRLSTAVAEFTKAEQLARELNDAGTTEFSDVLDAQESLYGAQLQLAEVSKNLNINYVALCQALGGGWAGEDAETFELVVKK